MPRGGRRAGRPGATYQNRSDLTSSRPLPVTAAPNQPYGVAGQQRAAQQAVPMAPAAVPTAAVAPPAPAMAVPPVMPGGLGAFNRPSDRPDEPVTAGLMSGAGPGPEALNLGPRPGGQTMSMLLEQVAAASGSTDLAQLAQRARSLGQ